MSGIRAKKVVSLLILFLGFSSTYADQIWDNEVVDSSQNVCDENLTLNGLVQLDGPVEIKAQASDVNVTMNGATTITGEPGDEPRLYIRLSNSHTVLFNVTQNLTFQGMDDGGTPVDLLVSVEGNGTVEFRINDNAKVSYTSSAGTGGAQLFVVMNSTASRPAVIFSRENQNSANPVDVCINKKSCFGYLSSNKVSVNGGASDSGMILFDPSNLDDGRLRLTINDKGSVIVSGRFANNLGGDYTLSDIDRKILAGKNAVFRVDGDQNAKQAGLQIINKNSTLSALMIDPLCNGEFDCGNGVQYGFIIGANGRLALNPFSYVDYVGAALNQCPEPIIKGELAELIDDQNVQMFIKTHNPSALIIDGSKNENAVAAQFDLAGTPNAIVFRSGIDDEGNISADFTIDPEKRTPGAGNTVLDVEGTLDVIGNDAELDGSKLEILSVQVGPSGGPVLIDGTQDEFTQRTFAKDVNGDLKQYNAANFLINNRMNLQSTNLVHSDEIHVVFEKDFTGKSEPTYIGGETFKLKGDECNGKRAKITLYDSTLHVHTNIASTGVDWFVPADLVESGTNDSCFIFYTNGYEVDSANGRQMVLGTNIGGKSCCETLLDNSSYVDVLEEEPGGICQRLTLKTADNNDQIIENLEVGPNECSIHTIYLNYASNICIGNLNGIATSADCTTTVEATSKSDFCIDGDFFSFETRGGTRAFPEVSNVTGEGGIFVDSLGSLQACNNRRANFSAMVVKSGTGVINLPRCQVFFDNRVGIAQWQLNLSDPDQRTIINENDDLSDYTLDWIGTQKDFSVFKPYILKTLATPCNCPEVTEENITAIPVIKGKVEQFQIKRSRLGDPVHILVDGGQIGETIFLTGFDSAEAPTGVIVLRNNGIVGLGTAHRNVDSLQASIKLGENGVTIIADGDGIVELNQDLEIDCNCSILKGPNFAVGQESNLIFRDNGEHELRVRSTGVLDFSSFGDSGGVEFHGTMRLVFEPGARWVLGSGLVRFLDNTEIVIDRVPNIDDFQALTPPVTMYDSIRAKFSGTGLIFMQENSRITINQNAFLGIETFSECSPETCIEMRLFNDAKFLIGSGETPGGGFQIGNTTDVEGASIKFTLVEAGLGTQFRINPQGFFGMGAGVVNKRAANFPNSFRVGELYNVESITFDLREGAFSHNQIFRGNTADAAIFCIGGKGDPRYSIELLGSPNPELANPSPILVLGGGNMFLVSTDEANDTIPPFVGDDNTEFAGIMTSYNGLVDQCKIFKFPDTTNLTPEQFFDYMRHWDVKSGFGDWLFDQLAPFGRDQINRDILGYVRANKIIRDNTFEGVTVGSRFVDPDPSRRIGMVGIFLDDNDRLNNHAVTSLVNFQ